MLKKIKSLLSKMPITFQVNVQTRHYPDQETELFYGKVIEPGEKYDLVFKEVGETKNLTISDAVRRYVSTNSTLKAIVDIYQTLLIKEWQWLGNEHNAVQIENYLTQRMFGSVHGMKSFIKRAIYFYVAEIGVAIFTRWVPDPENGGEMPVWELVPSLDLIFTYKNEEGQHDPYNGNILIIGRRVRDRTYGSYSYGNGGSESYANRIEVLWDESRTAAENMNFTYLPSNPLGNVIFGTSKIAGVLGPALAKQRLTDLFNRYLATKIDPHKLYTTDLRELIAKGLSPQQILEHLQNSTGALKKAEDKRPTGEHVISPFPVEVIDISGLEKDAVDGTEVFLEVYEPEIIRASGVPGFMLGGQRRQQTLNSTDANSARILFDRRLENGVSDFDEIFTEAIMPIAMYLGISEKMMFSGAYDDTEIQQIRGMIAKQHVETLDAARKAGFITQETGQKMLSARSYDFGMYMANQGTVSMPDDSGDGDMTNPNGEQ